MEHDASGVVEGHASFHQLSFAADDTKVIIALAKSMRHLEEIRQDRCGLQRLHRILNDIRILRDHADKINGMWLRQEAEIRGDDLRLAQSGLSRNGAQSSVSVLEVRSCIPFKRGHGLHVERIIIDPKNIVSS